ncbi:Superfamily II DNA helicase [Pyrenophora tritici-repentis]|nr:Superfamily II DNA helicase [Pyrenophora tritici-repentis]
MDPFREIFAYLPTHCIAICKSHKQGVVKSQLLTHLDAKHQELAPHTRRSMVQATSQEPWLRNWADSADQVIFPRPDAAPLRHLPVYTDGLKCQECGYINRSEKRIQEHGSKQHNWIQLRQKTPGQPSSTRSKWATVMCQKFQNTSTLGRLFEVQGAAPAEPDSDEEETQLKRALAAATTQIDQIMERRNPSNVIEEDSSRWGYQTWLNRAGWKRHLKGLDRLWLLDMAQIPNYHERALQDVCWAAEMVIWKAQQVSHSGVVGMPAMMHINRREYGTTSNEKPFNASQTEPTIKKYRSVWLQVIAYIWRTYELPIVQPGSSDGVQGRRPAYRLTSEQKECLEELKDLTGYNAEEEAASAARSMELGGSYGDSDSEDEPLDAEDAEALQDQVLALMLALLDHKLASSEYESGLISGMAVLGVSADRGWLDPLMYTPKQSAIVSISRMLVLYQAHRERNAQIDKLVAGGYSEETASNMAVTHFELVQDMCHRFMALTDYNGRPTPMDAILRLRAFGFKIRYTTNAEGVVDWVGDTLLYGQIQFSMAQLRTMVHGMIASTRQDMLKQLLLLQLDSEGDVVPETTPCPAIYWDKLVDNAAAQQAGWSFMEDARNRQATSVGDPKRWLLGRIGQEKRLRHEFADAAASRVAMAEGGGLVWVKERIQAYYQAMQEARHALAVLVHITGGAPPRGSELLTIRFQNDAQGNSRGIFIEDGAVVFVTTYDKNIAQTGQGKVIHRYVPREVGELVVFYLWFARPFWQRLVVAAWGEGTEGEAESGYMWEPRAEQRWQEPTRGRKRHADAQSTRRAGKASRVRTVARREVSDEEGEGESGEEREERQEGEDEREEREERQEGEDEREESRIRADRPPTVEQWNSNRLKLRIQKASLQYMGVKLNVIGWRHASKAIWRRYIQNPKARKAYLNTDEDNTSSEEDEAFDLQTGHSSRVAGAIYGRSLYEAVFSVESKRFMFRVASSEWHRFLELPSAQEKKLLPLQRSPLVVKARREALEEEYRRWKMMRLVDVDSELQRLVGCNAQFRSVQRPAMQAIMRYESPVVVIMGTGAGKSVLFMLPASVSTGVTVVVVPLVALRFDMKARCDELGIVSGEWDSRRPYRSVQIMFVTPEAAVGEAFGHYINRERSMGRLDRIVIDECHSILDSLKGFRSRLLGLRQLLRVERQMVYLTATLRPKEEKQFLDVMGLPEKSKCQWFRGRTTRKNIRYRVHEYNIEEEEKAVVELVEKLKERYPLPGQVIVYCGTIARTKRIGKVLGAACYYRAVGTVEEKKKIVRELTSGQRQVFTATNALGLGVDAPTIRAVWAGWTGWGKERGDYHAGYRMRGRRKEFVGAFGEVEEDMQLFVEGKGCMRAVLDWAMDGVERGMCEEDEVACQRCGWESSDEEEEEEEEEGVGEEGVDKDEEEEKEMGLRLTFEQQERQRQWVGMAEAERQCRDAMEVEELVGVMEKWGRGVSGV